MKFLTILLFFFIFFQSFCQIAGGINKWSRIGSNQSLVFERNDRNNGDGEKDGCFIINDPINKGKSEGIKYLFDGTVLQNQKVTISIFLNSARNSKGKVRFQLYNLTNQKIIKESALKRLHEKGQIYTLNHTFSKENVGDQIEFRIINIDLSFSFSIDWMTLNNKILPIEPIFKPILEFDIPIQKVSFDQINELNEIYSRLSNQYLGEKYPSQSEIENAINEYSKLKIRNINGQIIGNELLNSSEIRFLKTFSQILKFNPKDSIIKEKAINAVWHISSEYCKGSRVVSFYDYKEFCYATVFLRDFLPQNVKELFGFTLYMESDKFKYLFAPSYDAEFQSKFESISSDVVYLVLEPLFAYSTWIETDEDKIRFSKSLKRYLDRFLSYSYGTGDGIKKDGLGFHHWTNYDGYMYSFGTVSRLLTVLSETNFQIEKESYLHFRDALYAQLMYSNDFGVKPFSMSGRHPGYRLTTLDKYTLENTSKVGGKILGLKFEDPILVKFYNRKFGTDQTFKIQDKADFEEGFIQFNYGNLGVYRKNNWIAAMKGFSNCLWGSEIYETSNRYGRYQSYGALEIIYQGDEIKGNGFNSIGWNWNFNPGATTIVLPWNQLQASTSRIDERNEYGFSGSLAFMNKHNEILNRNFGTIGMFGMHFNEKLHQGFGIEFGKDTHNETFEFTKAYFAFADYIVCLGNSISNNDYLNPTVTTLFQRLDNNDNSVIVNGQNIDKSPVNVFFGSNWILDNYSTGYYIVGKQEKIKIKNEYQITPYQDEVFPSDDSIKKNQGNQYFLGYIDHGNHPEKVNYEYVVIPSTTSQDLILFSEKMKDSLRRPYIVHQNNEKAQIVEDKKSNTVAYSLPIKNNFIDFGLIKRNSFPCLIMYHFFDKENLILTISNPDLGIEANSYESSKIKAIQIELKGKWKLKNVNDQTKILKSNSKKTMLEFLTTDGLPVEIELFNIRN